MRAEVLEKDNRIKYMFVWMEERLCNPDLRCSSSVSIT